jgi:hypothetical protein
VRRIINMVTAKGNKKLKARSAHALRDTQFCGQIKDLGIKGEG